MSLTKRTANGIMWKGGSAVIVTAMTFLILAILARLLDPSDFGLRGIILIMMGLLTLLADLGLGAAVVYEEQISREQFSTIFFLNLGVGILLAAGIFFGSGALAGFFGEPRLGAILKVMSGAFVVCSLGSIFMALLQKRLDFKTRFKIEIAESLVGGLTAIGLAILGWGVWSLIYGYIIGAVLRVVLLWLTATMLPVWTFRLPSISRLIKFGSYVYGEQLLNFASVNFPIIIIGRFLGMETLGYYSLAYSIVLTPVSKISDSVTRVIFPAFSLIQREDNRLRDGYLRVVKFVSLVTFPMMAGIFAVSSDLIVSVYGPKWLPASAILRVFCLVGAFLSIVSTTPPLQYAKGRSDLSFKLNLMGLAGTLVAFFVGVRYGIMGVTVAYAAWMAVQSPVVQGLTNRLIRLGWPPFLRQFRIQAAGAVIIIVFVSVAREFLWLPWGFLPMLRLLSSVVLGLSLYSLLILWKGRSLLKELIGMFGRQIRKA